MCIVPHHEWSEIKGDNYIWSERTRIMSERVSIEEQREAGGNEVSCYFLDNSRKTHVFS